VYKVTEKEKFEAAMLGVRNSWDFFLTDRVISTWQCMEGGVKDAFKEWLDAHKDEVLAAIGKAVTDGQK
jgi:hypothetical protein